MALTHLGFVRVAAATPRVSVADPAANARAIFECLETCRQHQAALAAFPELCLTGYTCGDLFGHARLLQTARAALDEVVEKSQSAFSGVIIVGLPLAAEGRLYNVAAVVHQGQILGFVPKTYLPTYKEFYESRWFSSGGRAVPDSVRWGSQDIPFGANLVFIADDVPGLALGVEICEDLWMPTPPSSHLALQGASVLVNPSASTELVGKVSYRRLLVASQSGRCVAGYIYAGSGVHESTTDVVFGGHSLIAENGVILKESERFARQGTVIVADLDLERLMGDRIRQGTFGDAAVLDPGQVQASRKVRFRLQPKTWPVGERLQRVVDAHPFVPAHPLDRDERCAEIFHIQVAGLAKRLETVGRVKLTLGVSGGLDSTLALLVACKTLDALDWPRQQLTGFVMPGFGSTEKSRQRALALIAYLGVGTRETDIRQLCLEEMRQLNHRPFGIDLNELTVSDLTTRLQSIPAEQLNDLVFENVQARMRTSLLMNGGFVIGTGDLSELALGWCTYNGDQISMYNPNLGVPKTLVRFLVRWVADHEMTGPARQLLHEIDQGIISPELLPSGAGGQQIQNTEQCIGPYELQDFYLYYFLRFGFSPEKLLFLASQAHFEAEYSEAERKRWLRVFLQRFFTQQYKRSCLPDGPKVGSVSLSPRGDWRMPSDASAEAWLKQLEDLS
jgi:NAD+ synthase (glutamine-hydrolysing)